MKLPAHQSTLLHSARDPSPIELVNLGGTSPLVLTVEHAGRAIPEALGDLGVAPADMDRHIAYDAGTEMLGREMAERLDAPLFLQRYSRLVVDCNRPFGAPDLIPAVSDGTTIPANAMLSEDAKRLRFDEIHTPFHAAISWLLDERAARDQATFVVSIHSFSPSLAGIARPWQLGVLFNRDSRLAKAFLSAFNSRNPDIRSAFNQPYAADDFSDYTVPVHGEARGLPHMLLELRNDEISSETGIVRWSEILCEALSSVSHDFAIPSQANAGFFRHRGADSA